MSFIVKTCFLTFLCNVTLCFGIYQVNIYVTPDDDIRVFNMNDEIVFSCKVDKVPADIQLHLYWYQITPEGKLILRARNDDATEGNHYYLELKLLAYQAVNMSEYYCSARYYDYHVGKHEEAGSSKRILLIANGTNIKELGEGILKGRHLRTSEKISEQTSTVTIIMILMGILIVLLSAALLFFILRKRKTVNDNSKRVSLIEHIYETPIYADITQVQYAKLNVPTGTQPLPKPEEASRYSIIMGKLVLKNNS